MAVTFKGTAQSIIAYGNDATNQNLFVIKNEIGSRVDVNIRDLKIRVDNLVALTAVCPLVKVSRGVNISGGNVVTKTTFDTTKTSDPFVKFYAPGLDGSPITATAGDTIWQKFADRMHTAVEQAQKFRNRYILPTIVSKTGAEFKLRPGESLLVQVVSAAGTSNARLSNNWIIDCLFEEDQKSTFAISGTVTLSGSPITGARVMVIEADDELMTNAHLVEVITTPAGGTWASSILTGKVGAAFVQYTSGGTYYTAYGSPYLE